VTAERTAEQLAHAWREALIARDAPFFASLFAPDGVMIDVEHRTPDRSRPRPLEGRAEIERVTVAWFQSTPEFEYDVLDVIGDGDRAAALWRYEVPGAEGPIRLEGVTWLECSGGEIERALVYFDSFGLLQGLGDD
jgi:uncharacterized protein (TIGR02246 family)